ncbi:MAG: hypothetical protein ISS71_08835 [Phycisphaerae bacterium]|nr:hypothetical protein [Phycisphaerae bacterium]
MQKQITNIVFTKNRPMQLHGYLEGLRRFLPAELLRTVILYKPELFGAEYEYCFSQFPGCEIIRETDFHSDLLRAIRNTDTQYMLFGIDDVVYFDGVDFDVIEKTFEMLGADLLGFSLRLDKQQMPEDIEVDNLTEHQVNYQTVCSVDWTKGKTKNTRYPFELCATIYHTEDVKRIVAHTMKGGDFMHTRFAPCSFLTRIVSCVYPRRKFLKKLGSFYNPNTFESWCCRYVQNHPNRFGHRLAFQKICATAIQINVVNTSTANEWDDAQNLTVEALNENYQNGGRIDIDVIANNKPQQTHTGREFFKTKESGQVNHVEVL